MRNHKNLQIRPSFWEWDIFVKLGGGGNFSKPFFSRGIYTTLIMENEKNEKQKNLKTMKYLQQLKYPWSVRFPMIKKSLYFAKVTLEF